MLTPAQCRAARALLDWTQRDLARVSGVSLSTVADFENWKRQPHPATLRALEGALTDGGVRFGPSHAVWCPAPDERLDVAATPLRIGQLDAACAVIWEGPDVPESTKVARRWLWRKAMQAFVDAEPGLPRGVADGEENGLQTLP